ncbi:hypothetical protein [Methylocystis sp.]|uniref:hypothetical protein n=1 Tax=Methylocystis sp. TaxID=1911079 RepID=UPI0025F20E1D|nr:hypothetical protein [Methylocystis sp.]
MNQLLTLALMLWLLSSASGFARGPYEEFRIGNWVGGLYTSDSNNGFSHCAAYTTYNSQIALFVSITVDSSWYLGFHKEDWAFVPNKQIDLVLSFDGGAPVRVRAFPLNSNTAKVEMPVNSALINAFMEAQMMNAYSGTNIYAFSLEGTKPLLQKLAECLVKHRPKNQGSVAQADGQTPSRRQSNSTPMPQRAAPEQEAPPQVNGQADSESERERQKLISEAGAQHAKCLHSQMRQIVPYSNESAETLAQVVITKCEDAEKKFISLGMALFNASRAEVEKIVGQALEKQKKKMVADIVSFRAELNKAIMSQPKSDENSDSQHKKGDSGI